LKNLEHQHSALLDFDQIADSNVVDLTSKNASLNVEKDSLHGETTELINKVKRLEDQLNRFQEHGRAREEDFHALLVAEKEELRSKLSESLFSAQEEVTLLEEELESRHDTLSFFSFWKSRQPTSFKSEKSAKQTTIWALNHIFDRSGAGATTAIGEHSFSVGVEEWSH
jgi:chromosome segregation ATPase